MAESQSIGHGPGMPGSSDPPRTDGDARRLGWRLPLPLRNEQLETFQFVAWILIVTAFLFHFAEYPLGDWSHWLAWTAAIGGFALLERCGPWFAARGRAGF